MTSAKKPDTPPTPSPQPTAILGREEEEAKKKVGRRPGRASTILAGRMMSKRGTNLKDILG